MNVTNTALITPMIVGHRYIVSTHFVSAFNVSVVGDKLRFGFTEAVTP